MTHKICKTCNILKSLSDFQAPKETRNSRKSDCYTCYNIKAKQRRDSLSPEQKAIKKQKKQESRLRRIDKVKESDARRYYRNKAENPEVFLVKRRQALKNHYVNNKEYYLRRNIHRRAVEANAEGSYTQKEWDLVQLSQKNICNKCGIECKLSVDHIIPLSKGGSNYISNIQGLCVPCNVSKGVKIELTSSSSSSS